jgi:hypothetical protein
MTSSMSDRGDLTHGGHRIPYVSGSRAPAASKLYLADRFACGIDPGGSTRPDCLQCATGGCMRESDAIRSTDDAGGVYAGR